METPKKPKNERARQRAVERSGLLDTLQEESYDSITSLMAYVCDVPISLVALIDKQRNFLKSHHGVEINESPREFSICGHAILSPDEIFIVEDLRKDVRFSDNPEIKDFKVVFYAGVVIKSHDGHSLGTLCMYDRKPRKLDEQQKKALIAMGKQVEFLIEQQRQTRKLKLMQKTLREKNRNLKKFARVVSHDLKSPLSNIFHLTELLEEENTGKWGETSKEYLEYLKASSHSLAKYIDGLLQYYDEGDSYHVSEDIALSEFFKNLRGLVVLDEDTTLEVPQTNAAINTNRAALTQILLNLVTNATKYNSKEERSVQVRFQELENHYEFTVEDNGDGIPKENHKDIFELFVTQEIEDRDGNKGTGIGLALVKKLVKIIGGKITLESEVGVGSTFRFTVGK